MILYGKPRPEVGRVLTQPHLPSFFYPRPGGQGIATIQCLRNFAMHREEVDDRQLVVPVSGDADTTSAGKCPDGISAEWCPKVRETPFFCDQKKTSGYD